MDFLLTTETLPSIEKLRSCCLNQLTGEFETITCGNIKVFISDPLSGDKANSSYSDHYIHIFDGYMFNERKKFQHSLLIDGDPKPYIKSIQRSLDNNKRNEGVFCVGRINRMTGETMIMTDNLSQYPTYWYYSNKKQCGSLAVSNNIQLLKVLFENSGENLNRSIDPCLENVVYGGVIGDITHFKEIHRLPFGHYMEIDIRKNENIIIFREIEGDSDFYNYNKVLKKAHKSISGNVRTFCNEFGKNRQNEIAVDLTAGQDSRCVLSYMLSQTPRAFRKRIKGRCLRSYPNPDGNVAAYLMEKFNIPVATVPTTNLPLEVGVKQNAMLFGGCRDAAFSVPPMFTTEYAHLGGFFGEIAGAFPNKDVISITPTYEEAVDLFLQRQRKITRNLDIIKEHVLFEHIRPKLIAMYSDLEAAGTTKDHMMSESYLRCRCRSHFGLNSFIQNKFKIQPEILANTWLVKIRRLLPVNLHSKNKILFDLIVRMNRDEKLAFMPMDKKWDPYIVPNQLSRMIEKQLLVKNSTGQLSTHYGNQMLFSGDIEPVKDLPELVCKKDKDGISAKNLSGTYKKMWVYKRLWEFALENYDSSHDAWKEGLNREAIEGYVKDWDNKNLHKNPIATNTMGRSVAGFLWLTGHEMPVSVYKKRSISVPL